MAGTLSKGIKGNTKDIMVALFENANPKLPDVMSPADINKSTLADMLLARAGSMMLRSPERLSSLDTKIKSTLSNIAKVPAEIATQSEKAQSNFSLNETMRKSLEAQFLDYTNTYKTESQTVIREVLEGKITRDAGKEKLNTLDKKADDLTKKIEALQKSLSSLENDQIDTLKKILTLPGKNPAELREFLSEITLKS